MVVHMDTPELIDKKFLDKKFWLKNRYFLNVFWGRNLDPRRGVADAFAIWQIRGNPLRIYRKSVEIHRQSSEINRKSMENPRKSRKISMENHRKSMENQRKSMENRWKIHRQSAEIGGKSMENPRKKLIWQRWPATWSSEPSCMLGYRNNLSMHSQNTPKKSVRNRKLTQEFDPNNKEILD